MTYIADYLHEVQVIAQQIDQQAIESAIKLLKDLKYNRGRLFILGNGGSAANASHAVNDFRKIADIEAYAPSDHFTEVSAWANDVDWEHSYVNWLQTSRIVRKDMLLILSVGGSQPDTSLNVGLAMEFAHVRNISILSIVSRNGGRALALSNVCILVPVVSEARITPHAEEWQSIILHLLVNMLVNDENK